MQARCSMYERALARSQGPTVPSAPQGAMLEARTLGVSPGAPALSPPSLPAQETLLCYRTYKVVSW